MAEAPFVPDKTQPAVTERRRLWALANTRYTNDEQMFDVLSELDSELFDVVIARDGSDDVMWRDDV